MGKLRRKQQGKEATRKKRKKKEEESTAHQWVPKVKKVKPSRKKNPVTTSEGRLKERLSLGWCEVLTGFAEGAIVPKDSTG